MGAKHPKTKDQREYHLHTMPGDLSPLCLIVGAQGRAKAIAEKFFTGRVSSYVNENRGLMSFTGAYNGVRMSVTTSGMGGASTGIILPEAFICGGRVFIRVGSGGTMIKKAKIGDPVIVTGAWRCDGASNNWAPPEFPACPDYKVVAALVTAAEKLAPRRFHTGYECSTSDFRMGQGRPDIDGKISPRMLARHQEVLRLKTACYSMEAASLFVWCATHGGLPAGAINATFANRITDEWGIKGEMLAAKIALEALLLLSTDQTLNHFVNPKPQRGKK